MEHNIDNRDFERFLKQNADQYRMFPSEKVWEEIHYTLHTRKRRWYVLGLSLLLLTTVTVTGIMFLQHKRASSGYTLLSDPDGARLLASQSVQPTRNRNLISAGPLQAPVRQTPFISAGPETTEDITVPAIHAVNNLIASRPLTASNQTAVADIREEKMAPAPLSNSEVLASVAEPRQISNKNPVPVSTVAGNNSKTDTDIPVMALPANPAPAKDQAIVNFLKKDDSSDEPAQPRIPSRASRPITRTGSRNKPEWHLYMTPTVSYRTLSENMEYLSAARFNSITSGSGNVSYPSDVNTMVDHRPDIGFQLGLRSSYPVSRFLRFTAGLQFSVSKYDIKAYQHPAELTTIALSDRSVSTVSSFRNTNGIRENWLRNFYFAASIPVGLELKLSDGDKNYFGVAGTLQPTYVLDNRAWLISSDYKNYAEMPSLTRRWNMNTSFEIFAAQRTGKINWRVGPQVRYQMMSSFTKNYPIKEHLFDFGLKLGIQLQ